MCECGTTTGSQLLSRNKLLNPSTVISVYDTIFQQNHERVFELLGFPNYYLLGDSWGSRLIIVIIISFASLGHYTGTLENLVRAEGVQIECLQETGGQF